MATPKAKKEKFDTTAFVFETSIADIEAAMSRLFEQDEDPNAEPLTNLQLYWLGVWCLMLPDAKRRGLEKVPCCAQERIALGLHAPKKKRSRAPKKVDRMQRGKK